MVLCRADVIEGKEEMWKNRGIEESIKEKGN